MEEDSKFRVEKFNGQNFPLWKMQMEDYLYQKDLSLPLSRKTKKPTAMKNAEWEIIDRKALRTVRLCLAASVAFNISKETATKGLIKVLERNMKNPRPQTRYFL